MDLQKRLSENLLTLTKLEVDFKERFDDPYLFEQINIYRKSLSFFIRQNIVDRAIYESDCLVSFLLSYLID